MEIREIICVIYAGEIKKLVPAVTFEPSTSHIRSNCEVTVLKLVVI